MTPDAAAGVPVAFAEGVLDDVRELTAISPEDDRGHAAEAEALNNALPSCWSSAGAIHILAS